MATVYSESDVLSRLGKLEGGKLEDGAVVRTFEFPSFTEAIDFVCDVAEAAEEANHHPDIDVRYNRVRLSLTTHDAGGITDKDLTLAQAIDELT
ncbi:MAG: 4a-hydroxytetrahydrobiopterin dehydratase [Armatimonadetes bacterium]|nr:4a-hydroxytetrahydrobiopterin dehydratase [Armatimonadota bacterium]